MEWKGLISSLFSFCHFQNIYDCCFFFQVNSSSAVLNCQPPASHNHRRPLSLGLVEFSYMDRRRLNPREFPGLCSRNAGGGGCDGNRSSDSSEGFCENDADMPDIPQPSVSQYSRGCNQMNGCGDTDSQVRSDQLFYEKMLFNNFQKKTIYNICDICKIAGRWRE